MRIRGVNAGEWPCRSYPVKTDRKLGSVFCQLFQAIDKELLVVTPNGPADTQSGAPG